MNNITDIRNYIIFLKSQCGLSVTLHPIENEAVIVPSELITFNIHDNPYCIYIKSFPDAQRHCIRRQERVLKKCAEGSFCGSCFAGVRELVYPISNGHDVIGFICVSGYITEKASSFIERTSQRFLIPYSSLEQAYLSLNSKMPDKEWVDTLIMPLCNMLELAYIRSENGEEQGGLIDRILRYVKQNHTRNVTLEEICEHFSCSRSYISHNFKRNTNMSFREYVTHLRLEDAKTLLSYSKLSITEIALSVGFGDSAYFSSVFKASFGCSPSCYRKTNRE